MQCFMCYMLKSNRSGWGWTCFRFGNSQFARKAGILLGSIPVFCRLLLHKTIKGWVLGSTLIPKSYFLCLTLQYSVYCERQSRFRFCTFSWDFDGERHSSHRRARFGTACRLQSEIEQYVQNVHCPQFNNKNTISVESRVSAQSKSCWSFFLFMNYNDYMNYPIIAVITVQRLH